MQNKEKDTNKNTVIMLIVVILALVVAIVVFMPETGEAPTADDVLPESELGITESNLIIEVLEEGEGIAPATGDTAVVHYVGYLEDGTEFDSSYDRGEPFSFTVGVGQVIQGWDLGIKMMGEGGKMMLEIPPELAYGDNPPPGSGIPPGATLIFEIELLEIISAESED